MYDDHHRWSMSCINLVCANMEFLEKWNSEQLTFFHVPKSLMVLIICVSEPALFAVEL